MQRLLAANPTFAEWVMYGSGYPAWDTIEPAQAIAGFADEMHESVLSGLAQAPYRHRVTLRIQATAEQIRARLPASVASIEEASADANRQAEGWLRVDLRAERLDWVPAVLASLDRPFVIERPDELRGLVIALAERLAASARGD